ncbi:hypothetical protein CEXT_101351 [Caerostris extrusa]|uniref:Uncharacterized protein n=1 Tax=Caerostris extrusa TaxID=172846 RepID=A0AAV4SQ66_CAEEX|nr:hypothetical protein CEXT_101351 [Caerostris extrusa]
MCATRPPPRCSLLASVPSQLLQQIAVLLLTDGHGDLPHSCTGIKSFKTLGFIYLRIYFIALSLDTEGVGRISHKLSPSSKWISFIKAFVESSPVLLNGIYIAANDKKNAYPLIGMHCFVRSEI